MSAQWRDPFSETIRLCAEQGVDVVEVPSWTTNHCAYALAALRKYKVKGFTSSGTDPSKNVPPDAVEGKTIVCGHHTSRLGYRFDPSRATDCHDIFYGDGVIAIDSGTVKSGVINVLVLEDIC